MTNTPGATSGRRRSRQVGKSTRVLECAEAKRRVIGRKQDALRQAAVLRRPALGGRTGDRGRDPMRPLSSQT